MKLETDIRRIEELTRRKGDEDRRYRCLLDRCGLTIEEVDAIVHKHYRDVSQQIECRECGNCCRVFRPLLQPEDVDRLAHHLSIPRADLITKYLDEYENGRQYSFKRTPCPFLVNNSCAVYPGRPSACRSYPGLDKNGFLLDPGLAFSSCSVCPIVYNVYERVKREICGALATSPGSPSGCA
jgi:Fe-S-cluster containining protein